MENFKVIIVEDVPLELKGTEGIFKNDIPEAEIIGTAESEIAYWKLIKQQLPDLVLLDLGLGGSTTVGVEICRQTKEQITNLRGMPFGVKSLEKRQAELVQKLFPDGNHGMGINATRLVVKACELRILDIDHLQADEE